MQKKKIIYSLSSRGMYSELFNLCLATVYARQHHISLQINTYFWNARIQQGWEDYFAPTLPCCNNPFSAQDKVYSKEKPWIGKIYYNPKAFFSFYLWQIFNFLYLVCHPKHILTKDIFPKMRSDRFIKGVLKENAFNLMASSFKQFYRLNSNTENLINERIREIKLPNDYIGVHIRRGDKITSEEMQFIHIDGYVKMISQHRSTSSNVYIATDDISIIDEIKPKLESLGFHLFYNNQNKNIGFVETAFNLATKEKRKEDTLNVLLDMEVLIHSKFFIGTYTSNLSRVVPFFLGLDKCVSLDRTWNIINSMNGM